MFDVISYVSEKQEGNTSIVKITDDKCKVIVKRFHADGSPFNDLVTYLFISDISEAALGPNNADNFNVLLTDLKAAV